MNSIQLPDSGHATNPQPLFKPPLSLSKKRPGPSARSERGTPTTHGPPGLQAIGAPQRADAIVDTAELPTAVAVTWLPAARKLLPLVVPVMPMP
jgi:hypothetical protein